MAKLLDQFSRNWVLWVCGACAWAVLSLPNPASAYKRKKTCYPDRGGKYRCGPNEEPKPLHWTHNCIGYRIDTSNAPTLGGADGSDSNRDPDSHPSAIKLDKTRKLITESFEAWSSPGCTNLKFAEGPAIDASRRSTKSMNVIEWKKHSWPGSSADYALTVTQYNRETGAIHSAPILVNRKHHQFGDLDSRGGQKADLRNVLTHEIGHVIGLGHSTKPNATMFKNTSNGQIQNRTLHADDKKAVCDVYPASMSDSNFTPNMCNKRPDTLTSACVKKVCRDSPDTNPYRPIENKKDLDWQNEEPGEKGCGCASGASKRIPLIRIGIYLFLLGIVGLRRKTA